MERKMPRIIRKKESGGDLFLLIKFENYAT